MNPDRRALLARSAAACAAAVLPWARAEQSSPRAVFNPQVNDWRTFDVTTSIDVVTGGKATHLWLPLGAIDSEWQRTQSVETESQVQVESLRDPVYHASMVMAKFAAGTTDVARLSVTERVQVRNRRVDWSKPTGERLSAEEQAFWTAPTQLLPTDGIVRETALRAIGGAGTDVAKARAIYEWVVVNAFRDQAVKGCGPGDIRGMLESGNLGGKCADINALFVGLCRSVGVAARDVYGLRLAPSAFGYKQLGGKSENLSGAQHCRAEVFIPRFGWVAMDPADVTKVMRAETPEWLRLPSGPVVEPVHRALFGAWEGNWMGYNMAHDLVLPDNGGKALGFLMYPVGRVGDEPLDSYQPKSFEYHISAREVSA